MVPEYTVVVDLAGIYDTCLANELYPNAWSVYADIVGIGGKK
jgi:hypothetical protein